MKLLNRLLLINWHNIDYALIDFKRINFLTGENGAGKSTIIDAIQYVLQGNQKANYFNKAANEKAGRTVDSYIKCEISDDGKTGYQYKRKGNFSSYIAMEFYDDVNKKYFVLGVVFDAFDSKETIHKFFSIESKIPEDSFLKNDVATDSIDLRTYLEGLYGNKNYRLYQSDKEYQEASLAKLGSVNRKFYELFKKAVSFTPIEKIDQFIVDFVCNIKDNVDIESMKENIKHYTDLENDVKLIQERMILLEEIQEAFGKFQNSKEKRNLYQFLIDYSSYKSHEERISEAKEKIVILNHDNEELSKKHVKTIEEIKQKDEKIYSLTKKIASDDNGNLALHYEEEMKNLQNQIDKIESQNSTFIKKFQNRISSYEAIVRNVDESILSDSVQKECQTFSKYTYDCKIIKKISDIKMEDIQHLVQSSGILYNFATKKNFELENKITSLDLKIQDIKTEITELEKGNHKYDDKLIRFKTELESRLSEKYQANVEVAILADLLEIKDETWRNAIEGYLNTQRDYLIIEPKYFEEAFNIYREMAKSDDSLHSIGLIDLQKVAEKSVTVMNHSLALEVETQNDLVKKYVDYVLGNVIKCEDISQMRKCQTAITSDCMLYKNYVVRKINPHIFKNSYIGKNSIKMQLDSKKEELEFSNHQLESARHEEKTYTALKNIDTMSMEFVEDITENIELYHEMEECQKEFDKIKMQYQHIDLTTIYTLKQELEQNKNERIQLNDMQGQISGKIETNHHEVDRFNQLMEEEQKEQDQQALLLKGKYDNNFIQQIGITKYETEKKNKTNQEIILNFKPQLGKVEKEYEEDKQNLFDKRRKYIDQYKLSYNCYSESNQEYENAYQDLKQNELPSYMEKIKDSKKKAEEQFKEDFLAKLKQNIEEARKQINDLNRALKAHSFGSDSYEFKAEPNEDKRMLYNMITDPMLNEGYNLATEAFNQKYGAEIDEMFDKLKDDENVEEYTDYRNYLVFDLLVKKRDGTVSRLSKMLSKQSGGETQTPFYISVLASFSQLYHMNNNYSKRDNMINLVVFDEAFSKMDKIRIVESVKLLRKMGFQAIISAPPEKLTDIYQEVDATILVKKGKNATAVLPFSMPAD